MEPFVFVGIVVAVVLASSLLKFPWFSHKTRVTVATVIAVLGAAGHLLLTGDFESTDLLATSLQVFGASQILYQFILDGSSVDNVLENVGVKTNYDEV